MASAGTFKKDHGKEIKMFLTQGVNDILLKQITSPPTNGIEGLRNTLQLDGISLLSRMTDDGDIWNSPFLLRYYFCSPIFPFNCSLLKFPST